MAESEHHNCQDGSNLQYSKASGMAEKFAKLKPIDESSLKARLVLAQIRTQQSFKDPFKSLPSLLCLATLLQSLKYPIDTYSLQWFGTQLRIFSYIDISTYTQNAPSLVTSLVALTYCLLSSALVLFWGRISWAPTFSICKVSQTLFSSLLYIWVSGDAATALASYFLASGPRTQTLPTIIAALLSLLLFSVTVWLQTYLRFDFITGDPSTSSRKSNWSSIAILVYILVNELTCKLTDRQNWAHLIVMAAGMFLIAVVYFMKGQHQSETAVKLESLGLALNAIGIVLVAGMKLLQIQVGIGLFVILAIIAAVAIGNVQYFNISFELQNVNKWSNSQIMISYAGKLRKVLMQFHDYYYNTLFLGYIEIHQQKCDNQTCPLKMIPIVEDINSDNTRQDRFEDIIRKIYDDGLKLTPISPELQLEYALFHYESGVKESSLKMLLEIKEHQLSLDNYYKFCRLKTIIQREMTEKNNLQFLDILSEIKVKDLQDKIMKKFEEAALCNLQFWSILNEDHPDFRKLHDIGKNRVIMSEQVQQLYKKISAIANSEKVTNLYIHYLTGIENDEKLYSQIYSLIKNQQQFNQKIVIADWANNASPIMIVSVEPATYGLIIDLNTTAATIFSYERSDLLGKDVKIIFPDVMASQLPDFMDKNSKTTDEPFYFGCSNGYGVKMTRRVQNFSSIHTGLSIIVSLEPRYVPNSGFLLFDQLGTLKTLEPTCLQLLKLEDTILEAEAQYDDIFEAQLKDINDEKTVLKLECLLKKSYLISVAEQQEQSFNERTFNVVKRQLKQFYVIYLVMYKTTKSNASLIEEDSNQSQFQFHITNKNNQFTYFAGEQENLQASIMRQSFLLTKITEDLVDEVKPIYDADIRTLRLHENYIKVIEDSEADSEMGEKNSQTSTNNELILVSEHKISKVDEEKIFQSRESYCQFIDGHNKAINVRLGLTASTLVNIGIYLGLYFVFKSSYESSEQSYNRVLLENQLIGEIAECNRIALQTRLRLTNGQRDMDTLLRANYDTRLKELQSLASVFEEPFMLDVYIDNSTTNVFRSDEFILAFISEFSKLRASIANSGGFDSANLPSSSVNYIEANGNATKNSMIQQVGNMKQNSKTQSKKSIYVNIGLTAGGILMSLLLTSGLMYTVRKINLYKEYILSVFLEVTEKDIQNYSQKTENFLITLHSDESADNNEAGEQDFQQKKAAVFSRRKRFKTTNFSKTPYVVISMFFFFASAYYIHSFSYTFQEELFINEAIEYLHIVSCYRNMYATQQAKINRKLLQNVKSPSRVNDNLLTGEINSQILDYQKQLLELHYKTYGIFDQYHQKMSALFMNDICNGRYRIPYACNAGIMASNGTLLLVTDITMTNQNIDFAQNQPMEYYYSFQAIKQAHAMLLQELIAVNQQMFDGIIGSIQKIIIIWSIVLPVVVILIEVYMHNVVIRDTLLIKNMLKLFPISFVRQSESVKNFVAIVVEENGDKLS